MDFTKIKKKSNLQHGSTEYAGCLETKCLNDGSNTYEVTMLGITMTCTAKDEIVKFGESNMTVRCSDPKAVCQPLTKCPHDCFHR